MTDWNYLHPYPRYGLAAVVVRNNLNPFELPSREELRSHIHSALIAWSDQAMLAPPANPKGNYRLTAFDSKASVKQNAANGYYPAPHLITSANVASMSTEIKKLLSSLSEESGAASYEVKRSFSPLTSKINAGRATMANPKLDEMEAALIAVATITPYKAAAYTVYEATSDYSNTALIPDIALTDYSGQHAPLVEYVYLIRDLIEQEVGDQGYEDRSEMSNTGKRSFARPHILAGNYTTTFRGKGQRIGAVGLLSALGEWTKKARGKSAAIQDAMKAMIGKPIYLISYASSSQQRYSHHLVELSINGILGEVMKNGWKVKLNSTNLTETNLFRHSMDAFLCDFNDAALQGLVYHRALYPHEFLNLFKYYFMNTKTYPDEVVQSAIAYGRDLNRAVFSAASAKQKETGESRSVFEINQSLMLQLESIISSSKELREVVARLGNQAGRMSTYGISDEALPFLSAVSRGDIDPNDAKNMIMTFMRVTSSSKEKNDDSDAPSGDSTIGGISPNDL